MRRLSAALAAFSLPLISLAVLDAGAAHATGTPNIQITEVAYGGLASGIHAYAGDSGDGEYLELTNVGDAAQDMTGWYDDVAQGTSAANRLDLSGFGTVQPGESVIITDLSAADFRTEWGLRSSVKVITDKQGVTPAVTMNGGPDTIAIGNASGVADTLSYVAGDLSAKGVAAFVNAGQLAATSLTSGWTKTALVGDSEGSWTSVSGAVGSPAASTLGTTTPSSVRTSVSTALAVNGAANQSGTVEHRVLVHRSQRLGWHGAVHLERPGTHRQRPEHRSDDRRDHGHADGSGPHQRDGDSHRCRECHRPTRRSRSPSRHGHRPELGQTS